MNVIVMSDTHFPTQAPSTRWAISPEGYHYATTPDGRLVSVRERGENVEIVVYSRTRARRHWGGGPRVQGIGDGWTEMFEGSLTAAKEKVERELLCA